MHRYIRQRLGHRTNDKFNKVYWMHSDGFNFQINLPLSIANLIDNLNIMLLLAYGYRSNAIKVIDDCKLSMSSI